MVIWTASSKAYGGQRFTTVPCIPFDLQNSPDFTAFSSVLQRFCTRFCITRISFFRALFQNLLSASSVTFRTGAKGRTGIGTE